ncbi:MAG: hypothetical protein LBK99_21835 [Opitutaceae bacterium]|nr:hypothetical protein [Opitutaceae bacterium]
MTSSMTCIAIACAALSANASETPAQTPAPASDFRFYYQAEWGTDAFMLKRTADGGLELHATKQGTCLFQDEARLLRPVKIAATWRLPPSSSDNAQISIRPFLTNQNNKRIFAKKLARDGENIWTLADFGLDENSPEATGEIDITRAGFEAGIKNISVSGNARLVSCKITDAGNRTIKLFTDELKPTFAGDGAGAAGLPPLPDAPRVYIAEAGWNFSREDWIHSWVAFEQKYFPGQLAIDWSNLRYTGSGDIVRRYAQAGIPLMQEIHVGPALGRATMYNRGLWLTRHDGFNASRPLWRKGDLRYKTDAEYHSENTTNPLVLERLSADMLAAFAQGFQSYLLIDYVWPYFGGKWGYGESEIWKWKAYLLKTDTHKITLVSPDETWGFYDYWRHFCDVPLTPSGFGWKTWDDFECGGEFAPQNEQSAKRLKLFNALWHFQYLVFLDKLGRVADGRGKLAVSLNPEDINTGTDYSLLARLRYLHTLGIEYFGSPTAINAWTRTLAPLRAIKGGPQIDIIGEINAGGHHPSRYDRDTAFAFYYGVSTPVLPRNCNIQYAETTWGEYGNLDAAQRGRFQHWFAGSKAFLLRHKEEKVMTPGLPRITVVASRSILDYQPGSSGQLNQTRNIAPILAELNYDFLQIGRDIWNNKSSPPADTLVWSPAVSAASELRRAKEFLDTGEGKTLITHGGSPWRADLFPERVVNAPVLWNEHRTYHDGHVRETAENTAQTNTMLLASAPEISTRKVTLDGHTETLPLWRLREGAAGTAGGTEASRTRTLLASAEGIPLVMEISIPGNRGNRILHIVPELRPGSEFARGLLEKTMRLANGRSFAVSLPDWQITQNPVAGGNVFLAWHKPTVQEQGKPYHDKKYWSRIKLAGKAAAILQARVEPDKNYRVHSVFGQSTTTIKSDADGLLAVPLEHSPEMFYIGIGSGETAFLFDATIKEVAKDYKSVRELYD